jgi:hypothetical protein
MRTIAIALIAIATLAGTVAEANAVVCARGVYRAGCVGPRGAVGVNRYGYGAGVYRGGAVVRPGYGGAVVRRPYGVYRRPLVY